jgi:DNA polymerase-3 subunit beta
MKFSCDSSLLFKSINIVEKAIAQRTTVSVLENICFELSDTKLILRANDLEIGIEHAIDVTVDAIEHVFPTSVLIKGKTISGILSKISNQIIQITVDENNRFKIVGKGVNYDIMGMSADDFPVFPEIEQGEHVQLSVEEMRGLTRSTLFSVSSDETKPFLNGVFIKSDQQVLSFVATDGFRLALKQLSTQTKFENIAVIVPFKAMNELTKILTFLDHDSPLNMVISAQQVCFFSDRFRLVSRVINGHFPDYKQVIPKVSSYQVKVSRKDFIDACDRAMIIASVSNFVVRLTFEGDSLLLRANASLGEFREELHVVRTKGEGSVKISFNVKLILEGLRAIDADDIELEFNEGLSPCIIRSSGQLDYVYLAMPIRTNDYQEDSF